MNETKQKWTDDNRDAILQYGRDYYAKHKDKFKRYYKNNKERFLKNSKDYYKSNREKIKQYKHDYFKRKYYGQGDMNEQ